MTDPKLEQAKEILQRYCYQSPEAEAVCIVLDALEQVKINLERLVEVTRIYLTRTKPSVGCEHCILTVDEGGHVFHESQCILRPVEEALREGVSR